MLSRFNCVWLLAMLWTAAHQAPLSMWFSRQEYWSGLPFPSPIGPLTKLKSFSTAKETINKMNGRKDFQMIWLIRGCMCMCVCVCLCESLLYMTLCDPMDYSLPWSSVRGILQARILERVAIHISRGSSQSRARTQVSCTAGRLFTILATRLISSIYKQLIQLNIEKNKQSD